MQHLGQDLVLRAEGLDTALIHHQQPIDAGNRARAVRDDDDNALALPHAQDRLRQRFLAVRIEI